MSDQLQYSGCIKQTNNVGAIITLFEFMTMFRGTHNIPQKIPHIQT